MNHESKSEEKISVGSDSKHAGVQFSASGLLDALTHYAESPDSLKSWIDFEGERIGAIPCLSTWGDLGEDNWKKLGGGSSGRVIHRPGLGVELVTLGSQISTLTFGGLPSADTYLVHFLGRFKSNVGDNFYLSLEDDKNGEYLRFSNTAVTLANYGMVANCNTRETKLFSLVLSRSSVRLYIDGVLQKSVQRESGFRPQKIQFQLMGEHGPDLSALIHGFEVRTLKDSPRVIFSNEQQLFSSRLDSLIEEGNIPKLYRFLSGYSDDGVKSWIRTRESKILNLLDQQLKAKGVQEWVYDTLLGIISPEKAAEWIKNNRGKLPAPVLSTKNLTVDLLQSPNRRFHPANLLRRRRMASFRVLDNINFDVFPGDIVGIIGANGAGKSTLLKTLTGLMPIKSGEVVLRAQHLLLSAGLGARNELTGRENIYLAGTFMGLSKSRIDELFDEICEFSELGDAIDKPFKYYSDGMKGRLVFSLATSVNPDLLFLDELLSAGDIKFQKKAAERMEQLIDRAKAVVIVTHSMPFVAQRCNKALLISGGKLAAYGDPQEVIAQYLNLLHIPTVTADDDFNPLDMNLQMQTAGSGFADKIGRT